MQIKHSIAFWFVISLATFSSCTAKDNGFIPVSVSASSPTKILFQSKDVIWGFDFIDDRNIIFTERAGSIKILDIVSGKAVTVQDIPTSVQHGQGGMMEVAIHPDFKKNSLVYMSYTVNDKNAFETRIARAKLENNSLKNLEILFTSNSGSTKGEHFGSCIVFDHQGYIFFSVGERGNRDDAQNLTLANGKIHRLHEDGKIPTDNPFVNDKTAVPSIWSYGQRNPQGLYYDVATKTLWENEHGPRGGDEINIIEKGKNYGWPVITYGNEYHGPKIGTTHKQGMEQPFYYYIPSIATSGLTMFHGNLYSGALKLTHINRIVLKDKKVVREERLLENLGERIRKVRAGHDDLLYFSTDSGKIMQLKQQG